MTWPSWSPPPARRPGGVRGAGARDVRRDVHARAPAHRQRGGRARRGAGVLPAGLPGPRAASAATRSSRRGCTGSPPTAPTPTWPSAPAPPRRARRRRPDRRRPTRDRPAAPGRRHRPARPARPRPSSDLPPKLRAVVVLRDVYDLPHEAIAAELGISETAAKVRLHRARPKLRERPVPRVDATRRTPMRCEELSDDLAAAADGSAPRWRGPRAARRALPALPGRAGAVPQAPAGAARAAHRGPRAGAGSAHRHPGHPRGRRASARPSGR